MHTRNLSMKIGDWCFASWVESFMNFSGSQPMSEKQTHGFLAMFLAEKDSQEKQNDFEQYVQNRLEEESFGWRVIQAHSTRFGLDLTVYVKLFILELAESPGTIVMYLAVLNWIRLNNGLQKITMDNLAEIFPLGFVKPEHLETLWDNQKIPPAVRREKNYKTDNYLDII